MVTKDRVFSLGVLFVLWVMLMLALCCVPKSHGQTRIRNVAVNFPFVEEWSVKVGQYRKNTLALRIEKDPEKRRALTAKILADSILMFGALPNGGLSFWMLTHPPATPAEIDQQFQWAYQAAGKTKPWIVTTSIPSMIDMYFGRAYNDFGKTKAFIVTSNWSGDLDRYFDKLYMAINGGM